MSKVIFIGNDRKILEENSSVRNRIKEYGALFDELHIVLFTLRNSAVVRKLKISENIFVYPTNSFSRWLYPICGARLIRKIIKENGGDDWIISAQDPFEAGLSGVLGRFFNKAKLHIQIHTDFMSPFFMRQSFLNRLRIFISKCVLPKADGIRVVSERIANSLNKFKLKCTPYILPIWHDFDHDNQEKFDFKKKHKDWSFVIISVSRLESEKNVELSLKVLKDVLSKYPKTGLVILGSGTEEERLKLMSKEIGVEENVDFLGWQNNVRPYLLGADLFLQTSNFEGFGVSSIEASYANLPVVSTDVGASGWIFKDGVSAMICKVGDNKCLSSKIIEIIEKEDIKKSLIYGAKMAISHNLSDDKSDYLQKFKESLEKV